MNSNFKSLRNSKGFQKEASKLIEYVNVVERSLQAAEILQSVSILNPIDRQTAIKTAGLKEISSFKSTYKDLAVNINVLLPISKSDNRFINNEVIIAVTDACSIESCFDKSILKPSNFHLKSMGLIQEDVILLPSLLKMTIKILKNFENIKFPIDDYNSTSSFNNTMDLSSANQTYNKQSTSNKHTLFNNQYHVRIIGHSIGGSIAAYLAAILGGSIDINSSNKNFVIKKEHIGFFKNQVNCLSFGPIPCISRTIIPRYISSIICGDDIIARTTLESMGNLNERVLNCLKNKKNLINWIPGADLISDTSFITSKLSILYT